MKPMYLRPFAACLALISIMFAFNCLAQDPRPPLPSRVILRGDVPDLQIVDLRGQRKNDILIVQAELFNTSTRDIQIYHRFRWLDESGFQIGDGEVWKPTLLLGRQSLMLRGGAVSPKAADFRLEMSLTMQ